jgi:hypothetical protein
MNEDAQAVFFGKPHDLVHLLLGVIAVGCRPRASFGMQHGQRGIAVAIESRARTPLLALRRRYRRAAEASLFVCPLQPSQYLLRLLLQQLITPKLHQCFARLRETRSPQSIQ